MFSAKILIFATTVCSYVQYSELLPVNDSRALQGSDSENRMTQLDFMSQYGVTQEEIEEFHRLNGFVSQSGNGLNSPELMSQDRTFSRVTESLKFWNWPAFKDFQNWIEERRRRTTTIRPIPVYIVRDPNSYSYPYNNIL